MDTYYSVGLLCMSCMSSNDSGGICPFCGFDEKNYVPSPHHLPLRTILNEKYLVGRVLSEGGYGITYLGWDLKLNIKISIKEYYPAGFLTRENTVTNTVTPLNGEKSQFFHNGKDKFVDEAKRLTMLYALPGIVSIKDFFLENDTAYSVMEYVNGETLRQFIARKGGKVQASMIFELMKPLMNSLIEIHKSGIIHRDISPDNLIITKEGNIKLFDLGAACDFENSDYNSRSVMLKPGYAPEEQYRSKGILGPWTDIYALCATIYKAITGITPDEACERLQRDELKKPSKIGISIDLQKEEILMRGMAVLQEERFQSISDLMQPLYDLENQAADNKKITSGVTIPVSTIINNNIQSEVLSNTNPDLHIDLNTDKISELQKEKTSEIDIGINKKQNSEKLMTIKPVIWLLLAYIFVIIVILLVCFL